MTQMHTINYFNIAQLTINNSNVQSHLIEASLTVINES